MPRPSSSRKRSKAQKEQLAAVRFTGKPATFPDATLPDEVQNGVDSVANSPQAIYAELATVNQNLQDKEDMLKVAEENKLDLYGRLRVERRKLQRTLSRKSHLEAQVKLLKSSTNADLTQANQLLYQSKAENAALKTKLSALIASSVEEHTWFKVQKQDLQAKLKNSNQQKRKAQKRCHQIPEIKDKAAQRAKQNAEKENRVFQLCVKGIYKPQARELARTLVAAGCSQERVGTVIQEVCKNAGIATVGKMSQRTVSRAVLEGLVAAQVQLGHEMTEAEGELLGFTIITK